MFTLQDAIKYIGLAAIIYFLIKAFAANKLPDKYIIVLVILIMAIVIFIVNQQTKCPRKTVEGYQITPPSIVPSIYPGPDNKDPVLDKPDEWVVKDYTNEDIENLKDIMGINKETYEKLKENEQRAVDKITAGYKNEMVYTTTHPFNTIPLGTQIYGYTYLPPENWFRAYERPPVCISDKRCSVCPIADASVSGLMEFDASNNVLGATGIDLRYAKRVLNRNEEDN